MTRQNILGQLADLICAVECPHPVRVAIDGVDAAGKTTLANELIPLIEARARPVMRASVDGFHSPRAVRYRLGADSPEGYYRDSFDNAAMLREVLIPLGPGGNRIYRQGVFDFRADAPTLKPACEAPSNGILLFDGVFLLRPELVDHWDLSIFIDVDFEISVPRAVARDLAQSRGHLEAESIRQKYARRYVPGQRIYLAEANPRARADVVWRNNHLDTPILTVREFADAH
jgi:uridine kinase